ncbi:MAG: transposase [bacterium]|nr:transposase [bacterium]
MRKAQLANDECYHIFNRGVDKRKIFSDTNDYERYILSMILMNDEQDGLMIRWRNFKKSHTGVSLDEFLRLNLSERKKLVEIIAYCCNPNHYHFILKQLRGKGIERFMQKIATGYTMYFNEKKHRSGSLFQGRFKSTHIDNNDLLLHLSVYVNFNSEIHGIEKAEKYRWCSLPDYMKIRKDDTISVNKSIVLDQFTDTNAYKEFSTLYVKYFKERKADEKI